MGGRAGTVVGGGGEGWGEEQERWWEGGGKGEERGGGRGRKEGIAFPHLAFHEVLHMFEHHSFLLWYKSDRDLIH